MAKRYGHIGSETQRTALDALVQRPQQRGAAANPEQDPQADPVPRSRLKQAGRDHSPRKWARGLRSY